MTKKPQKTQYTFRIAGTVHQYIEVAFSEQEAREALAQTMLIKAGLDPDASDFRQRMEAYMEDQLILVQKR